MPSATNYGMENRTGKGKSKGKSKNVELNKREKFEPTDETESPKPSEVEVCDTCQSGILKDKYYL